MVRTGSLCSVQGGRAATGRAPDSGHQAGARQRPARTWTCIYQVEGPRERGPGRAKFQAVRRASPGGRASFCKNRVGSRFVARHVHESGSCPWHCCFSLLRWGWGVGSGGRWREGGDWKPNPALISTPGRAVEGRRC